MVVIYYIYKLTLPDGMCYIGSTNDKKNRMLCHISSCFNENSAEHHKVLFLYIRDNNISWDDITHDILGTTVEFRFHLEQWHLDQQDPELLLNVGRAYTSEKE